jgi:hypothetical protein
MKLRKMPHLTTEDDLKVGIKMNDLSDSKLYENSYSTCRQADKQHSMVPKIKTKTVNAITNFDDDPGAMSTIPAINSHNRPKNLTYTPISPQCQSTPTYIEGREYPKDVCLVRTEP